MELAAGLTGVPSALILSLDSRLIREPNDMVVAVASPPIVATAAASNFLRRQSGVVVVMLGPKWINTIQPACLDGGRSLR